MEYPQKLSDLLGDIEAELRRLGLWEERPPPPRAFESTNPFCFDTMTVPQWLQWVFIPRMRETLSLNAPLAAPCEVAPALEIYFSDVGGDRGALVALLEEFDALMPDPVVC